MTSKRLARSCAGREGVRERARRLLGETEDCSLRGEVLTLLFTGKVGVDGRVHLVSDGEEALGGRRGSDWVVLGRTEEEPAFGNKCGVVVDAKLRPLREVDAGCPDGVDVGDLLVAPLASLRSGLETGDALLMVG